MGKLASDTAGTKAQVFTPHVIVEIALGVEWTPPMGSTAFCVPDDTTYTMTGTAIVGTLFGGAIRGIIPGYKYTFSSTFNIEVM